MASSKGNYKTAIYIFGFSTFFLSPLIRTILHTVEKSTAAVWGGLRGRFAVGAL